MKNRREETAANAIPDRELLVKTTDGELKIQIPWDAKLTFGPAIPYAQREARYGAGAEYSLRIYQGSKENLVAVFSGVREFRDSKMPVAKLVVREAGKSVWKSNEEGYRVETNVRKDKAFVAELDLLAPPSPKGRPERGDDNDLF